MPTYAGAPGPRLDYHSLIASGDSANVSALSLGSHTGTHVDAPHHFIDGASTMEAMPLASLVGPAHVIEYAGSDHITAAELEAAGLPADARRLLLKTPNGRFWEEDEFHTNFIGLAPDAAPWLVERRFLLVGIDYLSIERFRSPGHEVHKTLLAAGVVIVEGLDLRRIPPRRYNMALPPPHRLAAVAPPPPPPRRPAPRRPAAGEMSSPPAAAVPEPAAIREAGSRAPAIHREGSPAESPGTRAPTPRRHASPNREEAP